MAFTLFRRRRFEPNITAVYGAIVAQARHPAFYADYGVPDTVDGRFDMIVLHLALLVRRLRSEPEEVRSLGQQTFDAFCQDMDRNLREMGLSDTAVPRRMRRFGEAFYGRAAAYDRALDAADPTAAVAAVLIRNVLDDDAEGARRAERLARYVRTAEQELAAQPAVAFGQGALHFPAPDSAAGAGAS